MKVLKIITIIISSLLFLTSCKTLETFIIPSGKKTELLLAEKNKQIQEQNSQIQDLKNLREIEQKESAKVASSVKAILEANKYVEPILPKEAIQAEAEVAQKRLPTDDPAETVRALERVMLIITGQRDQALKKYGEVYEQIRIVHQEIQKREDIIKERNDVIKERDNTIITLKQQAIEEQKNAAKVLADTLATKEKEKQDLIKKYQEKEKAWWVNASRLLGLGFIAVGVLAIVVLKAIPEGAGMTVGGILIGLVSIFIDWLTAQWWFPWLMGLLLLGVIICVGRMIYKAWKTKTLHEKTVAAVQDFKDESVTLGNDLWEKFEEHAKYRLGGKDSKWGKEQMKELGRLGLINLKEELNETEGWFKKQINKIKGKD